jgi:hypothetical protein
MLPTSFFQGYKYKIKYRLRKNKAYRYDWVGRLNTDSW